MNPVLHFRGSRVGTGNLRLRGWLLPASAVALLVAWPSVAQQPTLSFKRETGSHKQLAERTVQPRMQVHLPEIIGSLSGNEVSQVIRSHAGAFHSCYVSAPAVGPAMSGEVVMQWTIGSDGAAQNVEVGTSGAMTAAFADCLTLAAGAMQFPAPPEQPVQVRLPLHFSRVFDIHDATESGITFAVMGAISTRLGPGTTNPVPVSSGMGLGTSPPDTAPMDADGQPLDSGQNQGQPSALPVVRGHVLTGPTVIEGATPGPEIEGTVARQLRSFRRCYNRALLEEPGVAGEVVVRWTILEDGKADAAHVVESAITTPGFDACIAQIFDRMRFNMPDVFPVYVNQQLTFTSE